MSNALTLSLIATTTGVTAEAWRRLDIAIGAWAKKITDVSTRRHDDLIRDKLKVVYDFLH